MAIAFTVPAFISSHARASRPIHSTPNKAQRDISHKAHRKKWNGLFLVAILAIGVLFASRADAQPSDAQIKRDLTSPGVLSVTLHGRGVRSWSSAWLQYFWERGATVLRKARIPEYPNAKVEVQGSARYTIVGGGFRFRDFSVSGNRYYGLPAPNQSEVLALVKNNLPQLLGYHYRKIVGDLSPAKFPAKVDWFWHTPNSVSFPLSVSFTEVVSNTQTEKQNVTFNVRLYRDSVKSKWKSFIATQDKSVSLGKTTYSADDIKAMKSLADLDAESSARAQVSTLPTVTIPDFKSDLEFFAYLHNALRGKDAAQLEAILRKTLSPSFYAANSDVLLTSQGEELVNHIVQEALKGKSAYAEQYGPDASVKHYQTGLIQLWNADGRHFSRIAAQMAGGHWENGVKVGQKFVISDIDIHVVDDADEIARLRSLTPEARFAPPAGAKRFSQLGQQVAAQNDDAAWANIAAKTQWTPVTDAAARLKISFPGQPKATDGTMNGKYPMRTLEASNQVALCRTVSIVYPVKLNRMQSQTVVNSTIEQLTQANNARLTQSSEYASGAYGKMFVLEKGDTVIKGRVFVVGDVLYQLIMSGSKASWQGLNEGDFFNSFSAQ
jgi:hypothetical protein